MKKHFSPFKLLFNSLNSLFLSATSIAALLSLLTCLASCRNELLEPPDFSDRGVYSSTDISTPEGVTATQGGFRSITVSWNPVENAVKYEVYITKIATDAFEKRTETNGNDKTSVVILEDADVLAYFKVKAYDKNGNASEFSKMCHGTTLGEPIITNIIQDEFGRSATVRWWCGTHFSADTYKNDVKYSIALYADAEGATKIAEQEMDGSAIKIADGISEGGASAECTFTGLSPKTTYYYQVKAYLKGSPENVEASVIVDRETARRLIPNPVEELEATQGISDKEVTLSFILPDLVDVKESSDVFLKKPLYFEISRAEVEYTASDEIDEETGRPIYTEGKKPLTDYAVIATIRAAASSGWNTGSGSTYYFDSTNDGNNTSSKKLTLEKTDGVELNEGESEPYIPGYKLTFTDTTARRGDDKPPVYSYKITSYADIEKKVTSDESVAKTIGWLIGNLNMDLSAKKVDYEYTDETKKQISKITVKFSCTIEDYGKEYTYIVTQSAVDLENNPIVDEEIVKSVDINELKDFSVVYDLSKYKEGYYSYKFYIAPKGTANPSDAYYCYDKYKTKTPVVNSRDKLLEIEKFEVEDGYKDKFVIKWSYNPDFAYELSWTPVVDGVDQEAKSIALSQSNENNEEGVGIIKSVSNGIATFEHEAESGDARKYTMQITSGFGIPNEFERPSYTLGTAVAEQIGYAYDTITIKWNKIRVATSYTINARYEGEGGETSFDTTETSYTFTPEGYNNAKSAGKEMKVYVMAKNAKDSTKSEEISARLIGPAEVKAKVNTEAAENSISVSWKEVEGANGYLIRRVMYSDTAMTSVASASDVTYYYDASSKKIALTNDGDVTGRATVNHSEAGFTLTDEYMESDTTSEFADYQKAQAKISWGLPFRYVVLPVLEKDDFDFKNESPLEIDSSRSKLEYTDLAPTDATATWGYGLNLVADKATSGTIQNIKWDEPYNAQRDGSDVLPVVYYRAAGSSGEFRRFSEHGYDDVKGAKTALKIDKNDYYEAFEYVVKYCPNTSEYNQSGDIPLPPSLSEEIKARKRTYETPAGDLEEQDNKGYLLTIKDFSAGIDDTTNEKGMYIKPYYEKIWWDSWAYEKRAVGPASMTIFIQNNNISADWNKAVTIEEANSYKTIDYVGKDIDGESLGHSGIRIKPASISADGTGTAAADGLLKVLRDYKHYYTFELQRTDNGKDITVPNKDYYGNDNYIKTAYRQITAEEMVRVATLTMTIGMRKSFEKRGGSAWGAAATHIEKYEQEEPGGGTAFMDSGGSTKSIYHDLTYTNFYPVLKTKSGESVTFLKLNGTVRGNTENGYATCPPKVYDGTLSVFPVDDKLKDIYSTTITFSKLNKELNNNSGSITIEHPVGNVTKSFANITPLPFGHSTASFWTVGIGNTTDIDFQDSAEQWQ